MRVFWDRGQLRQLGQLVFANIIIPPGIFRKFTQRGKHFPFLLPQPMEDCWGQSQMQLPIAVGASPFCQRKIVLWWFLNYFSFGLVARQMAKFPYTREWGSTTLPVTDYCWQVVHRKRMDDQSECEWPMHHCDITCCWGCEMGVVECWNEWRKMTNYEWCDRWNNTHLHRLGFCGHNVITW